MIKQLLYKKLAKFYDNIYPTKGYAKKDYAKEVDFIESALKKNRVKGKKILDVACGTGTHMKLLIEKGYSVAGIDINPEMLNVAKRKVKGARFLKGDMKTFDLKEKFDCITCLFASMNYNLNKQEMEKTLRNFYNHMNPKGVLIFDLGVIKNDKRIFPTKFDTYSDNKVQLVRFVQHQYPTEIGEFCDIFDFNFVIFMKEKGKVNFFIDEHKVAGFDVFKVERLMNNIGFKTKIYDNFSYKLYSKNGKRPVFVGVKK